MSFHEFVRSGGGTAWDTGAPSSSISPTKRVGAPPPSPPSSSLVHQLFRLSTSVTRYQNQVNSLGGPSDTSHFRSVLKEDADSIVHVAEAIKDELTGTFAAETDPHRRTQIARLATEFQETLKLFHASQEFCATMEKRYLPKPGTRIDGAIPPGVYSASKSMTTPTSSQVQSQVFTAAAPHIEEEVEHREALLAERDQHIKEIHGQIREVNEIFRDLAVLVVDQGEQLYDVEAAVLQASGRTKQAEQQLTKASSAQKKSYSLLLVLLMVLVGVVVVVLLLS